uniref:SWIM-type domain-containing protein n=1 Tax=Spumella elongata TaxID=89044 RepID=A0A7S3H0S9_9STRA
MGAAPKKATTPAAKSVQDAKAVAAPAAAPAFPAEKRARRHVSKPNADVRDRISRAFHQKLFLVDQEDITSEVCGLGRKFAVMGTTGNIYDVKIQQQPTCSCPDCARGKLCKHIIFVMVKVLQVDRNSELIYQNALLQSELSTIFIHAPPIHNGVLANRNVVNAYKKAIHGEPIDLTEDDKPTEVPVVVEKKPEGECPVCFDSLEVALTLLDSCATCRNFIHKECLQNWIKVKRTCCYCRSSWCSHGTASAATSSSSGAGAAAAGVARDEGYVNLGAIQGLSGRRDTSSYHYNRYGRYGYHYGDEGGGDY